MKNAILAALFGLSLAGCAADGTGGACGLALAGDVPVRVEGRRPVVEMKLNGKLAGMLIDTGAQRSMLRDSTAKNLSIAMIDGGAYQMLGLTGPTTGKVGVLKGATIGSFTLPELRLPVSPNAELLGLGQNGGLIGMDVLGEYEVDLDLPGKRMRLYSGTSCTGEALPLGSAVTNIRGQWTHQVSYERYDERPYIRATADGHEVTALLDSGAQSNIIYADMAAGLGVTSTSLSNAGRVSIGGIGNGRINGSRLTLAELRIGNDVLKDLNIVVLDRAYPNDTAMLIGGDYISTHRIWLAPKRRAIFVATN